ncbi:hypothetical protein BDY19DRAFT_972575 [Irpex rosettiformis]|uniref:Uncharacterized protein n=1 Tax=Irpex rosettiformis TaxID=378272 RepID=A0ACB8TQR8_9APHY|nr:hypothetical protein BDY19DRAFT_972575 [Irpex rosettiformis]
MGSPSPHTIISTLLYTDQTSTPATYTYQLATPTYTDPRGGQARFGQSNSTASFKGSSNHSLAVFHSFLNI